LLEQESACTDLDIGSWQSRKEITMKKLSVIVLLALVVPCVAFGQATSPQPPKPGPEYQKLAAFVGSWTTEGEVTESPFGPAEKWSGKSTTEWYPGNFAVVTRTDTRCSVSGERHELGVTAYDGAAKAYTWYGVDNLGMNFFVDKISISGDMSTAAWETKVKGKTYKVRGTQKGLGSDKITSVQEYSEDGKVWKAHYRSTDTRVKSK
jgi:hypothetical protein